MSEQLKTIEECKAIINEFAIRFKLIFQEEGEVGIGRECVGLTNGNNYVEYNPSNIQTGEDIPEFYNPVFNEIAPPHAYHKHPCIAVLGRGEEAIRELTDWVIKLNELGVIVENYPTGATGMQILFSGTHSPAVRIPGVVYSV